MDEKTAALRDETASLHESTEKLLCEIYALLTPIVRVLSHESRDVEAERLILARINQERAERNDKSFIAGLEFALRCVVPGGSRFVAVAYLSEVAQ